MRKEVKKCIRYYLDNINSDEYKQYIEEQEIQSAKIHYEYIEKEKLKWADRTDFYKDYIISNIMLYDVLSNNGVAKLLKKLYSLSPKRYKIKSYYKKPALINRYDYIHLQYNRSSHGRFAEIELLEDKYIKSIEISWSQINNYYALLEYNFIFRKCLDDKLYDCFIYDNITKLNSKDYVIWYRIDKTSKDDYLALEQMNDEYFAIICQHYITSILYSEDGKMHQLVNMTCMTRKEPIDIEKIYLHDMGMSYYNKKSNYIISCDYDRVNYYLLAGNNTIPYFNASAYVCMYGNDFYYYFFGNRELKMFEVEFSKYSTGRKKIKYNKKFRTLLNKIQGLSDYESRRTDEFYEKFSASWELYVGNDKSDLREYYGNRVEEYKEIYEKNFSYLKLLSEMNYTNSNQVNTLVATVASIIATIIAVISLLK